MKLYEIMEKQRMKKHHQFMDFCKPTSKDTVLDAGTQNEEYKESDNFLEKHYPYPQKITGLSNDKLPQFAKRYPKVKAVTYNGKVFPFKDKSFDFVWSNAVIEHVGNEERQQLFLSEMVRVAKRKVVFTTPNRGFPVEIHTRFPLIHWLPRETANKLYIKLGKKWAAGDYMHLLTRSDLVRMLEKESKKQRIDYKIINNRFLGFTATFTVCIEKR